MPHDDPSIVIVGAGMAGIAAAVNLRRRGIDDFVILEKADRVGGVWLYNTYPGCECDVTSPMYSFSFAPNSEWSSMYSGHEEIRSYIEDVFHRQGLAGYTRFKTEVGSYHYDDATERWRLETADGEVLTPRVVIAGIGALHVPQTPHFAGIEEFAGRTVHAASWDPELDLTGRRVAVIGTGSAAVQIVPEIAGDAQRVTVVQRTPQWVLPKPNRRVSRFERWLFRRLPSSQRLYRGWAYWTHEAVTVLFMKPSLLGVLRWASQRHLHKQVSDPGLRAALTPDYTVGCKRMLLTSDYYPALERDDVELVDSTIERFDATGFRTADGRRHDVDVVVFATGFATDNRLINEDVVGTGGLTIQEAWRDGMRAHLGTTVAGFPNLFLMMGPNSGGGSQSILFVIETQAHYIAECVAMMRRERIGRLEMRADVQDEFNEEIHGRLDRSVWNIGGCDSWFLDRNGVNRQAWPGSSAMYWLRTRRPRRSWFYARPAREFEDAR